MEKVEQEADNSVSATLPEVGTVLMVLLGVGQFQLQSHQEPRARLRLGLAQHCHHLA